MAGTRTKVKTPSASHSREASENRAAAVDPLAGWPRRPAEELDDLARAQGVPLEADVDALAGDFWPEDESCDEFIAAYRGWRHRTRRGRGAPSQ